MDTIMFKEHFSAYCGDSTKAVKLLKSHVLDTLDANGSLCFDLEGIRGMNDSFANAFFGNMAKRYGTELDGRARYVNCNPTVRDSIVSALNFGLARRNAISDSQQAASAG